MSHPKALVDVINNISLHPALFFLYMYIHNYSSGAAVKVNALSSQLQIQTYREGQRQWDGVSLQMCIPPASGVIKPLNIA